VARSYSLVAVAALLFSACERQGGEQTGGETAQSTLEGHVMMADLPGWQKTENTFGVDHAVQFSQPPYVIRLQLLGGAGSRYVRLADVLTPVEAGEGKAQFVATLGVAERSAMMYQRDFQVYGKGGAASEEPPTYVREELVLVPAGKRFFQLSLYTYSRSGQFGPPHLAWPTFLNGFKILKDY
jgi:hypothetical protein